MSSLRYTCRASRALLATAARRPIAQSCLRPRMARGYAVSLDDQHKVRCSLPSRALQLS